jgi:hypothetical protein
VPSQFKEFGCKFGLKLMSLGSNGVQHSETNDTITQKTTSESPKMATGESNIIEMLLKYLFANNEGFAAIDIDLIMSIIFKSIEF